MVITHQHIDHRGLVGLVASRSGAEVAALDALKLLVERFSDEAEADDEFATDIMLRHGIPEDVVSALGSEVLGHTDMLLDEGQVEEVEEGGVVRFEAVA